MRHAFLLPVSVALGTVALIAVERVPDPGRLLRAILPVPDGREGPSGERHGPGNADGRLADIGVYRDPELAFDLAVPAGWTPIEPVAEAVGAGGGTAGVPEPGRSIGFEAPRDGPDDVFADYVMIEILPGDDSGRFLTDGSRRSDVEIDGRAGSRDSLVLEGHEVGGTRLDLVVHQAEIRGLGWTIGFYAIGETRRARLVEDAFELMIRTFRLPGPPFLVV